MRSHRHSFTIAMTGISRALLLRDRMLGRVRPVVEGSGPEAIIERKLITSGRNVLDAVWVRPATAPVRAVVLVCHGICETVEHWVPVQRVLAAHGAASLVFDYSGYGRSSGRIEAAQCEQDAIAAFEFLQKLAPGAPIAVLGFSLGSGIAAAVMRRVRASRLVLCAGFTSFRAAAHSVGIPVGLAALVPPLWHAEESLRGCDLPILVVHGERDRIFPVKMAAELAACCGAETILVPNLKHAEPYYHPQAEYWGPIVTWIEG
ncbi:MAG: alpha/beta fold hydrolase [Acidobacteriaceae bacterium]